MKFKKDHIYMHLETGGVIKILARVDSPTHGDIFIGEHILSGRLLALDVIEDISDEWADVTNRDIIARDDSPKYS